MRERIRIFPSLRQAVGRSRVTKLSLPPSYGRIMGTRSVRFTAQSNSISNFIRDFRTKKYIGGFEKVYTGVPSVVKAFINPGDVPKISPTPRKMKSLKCRGFISF